MKSSVGALITLLGLVVTAAPGAASVTVSIPASRDAIIATPHKKNNDGSWGYGWNRKTTRALVGFDVAPIRGRTVEDAFIKLYVAQNHFTAAGTVLVAHVWEPSQGVPDWVEGANLFNRFGYCNNPAYRVEAREYPTEPLAERRGVTWKCSVDDDYLKPGGTDDCAPMTRAKWLPAGTPEGQRGIHKGFMQNIDGRTSQGQNIKTEKLNVCASPPCDRDCNASIECIKQPNTTVDDCWRTVTIRVTTDLQQVLAAVPSYDNPSWLIKRKDEQGEGAFHFFSREGAICNKGIVDLFRKPVPAKDSAALQPMLVVTLSGTAEPAIPRPAPHCGAYQ